MSRKQKCDRQNYVYKKPVSMESLSKNELDFELQKGLDSLKSGKVYTPQEIDDELAKRFGI